MLSLVPRPSLTPYHKIRGRPGISYHMSDVTGRWEVAWVYSATTPPATHCEAGWKAKPAPAEVPSLQPLPAVDAGSFGVVLIAGKHVCMFKMCGCKSTRAHANEIDHNL